MPINKKLIHFNTKLNFLGANGINNQTTEDSNGNYGNIPKTSIVFIKDTQEIWTHGLLYGLQLKEVTWSELKALRDWVDPQNANNKGKLIPGLWYRITDYTCTTTQENTQSAGHVFDIIVKADDKAVLNENAYAAKHIGDTYFADSKLEAWELKYCLDNDTTKFAWADSTNGKGVIYYMKDEWDNECPYDFKNIKFVRYLIISSTISSLVDLYSRNNVDNIIEVDNSTPCWAYTFTMFDNDGNAHDVSVEQDIYISDENCYYKTKNNVFKSYWAILFGTWQMVLPNNVLITNTSICSIEEDYGEFYGFSDNLFGYNCKNNTFGNGFSLNIFGNECSNNTFGNYCYNNVFGSDCSDNVFGDGCNNNTFGNNCVRITFGLEYSSYNIIEDSNYYITLISTQTTSYSNPLRNIKICQGVNNTTTTKTISHNTVNDTFQTEYKPANSQVILV